MEASSRIIDVCRRSNAGMLWSKSSKLYRVSKNGTIQVAHSPSKQFVAEQHRVEGFQPARQRTEADKLVDADLPAIELEKSS